MQGSKALLQWHLLAQHLPASPLPPLVRAHALYRQPLSLREESSRKADYTDIVFFNFKLPPLVRAHALCREPLSLCGESSTFASQVHGNHLHDRVGGPA